MLSRPSVSALVADPVGVVAAHGNFAPIFVPLRSPLVAGGKHQSLSINSNLVENTSTTSQDSQSVVGGSVKQNLMKNNANQRTLFQSFIVKDKPTYAKLSVKHFACIYVNCKSSFTNAGNQKNHHLSHAKRGHAIKTDSIGASSLFQFTSSTSSIASVASKVLDELIIRVELVNKVEVAAVVEQRVVTAVRVFLHLVVLKVG